MATLKVELRDSRTNRDGTHPVRIVVIHNRKRKTERLFSLKKEHWDQENSKVLKSHPNHIELNYQIAQRFRKLTRKIQDLEDTERGYTVHDVFDTLTKASPLVDAIQEYADDVERKNARKYLNLKDKVDEFRPGTAIDQVDLFYMKSFKKWLKDYDTINSIETVNRYLKFLKTSLNRQYKKGKYHNREVLAFPTPMGRSSKTPLSKEEFESMEAVELDQNLALTRDCFCLMVYMRGIRISDMLKLESSNISNGRARYKEQKTSKDQDIKLIDKAQVIIDRYRGQSKWYVLPYLTMKPTDPKKDPAFDKHIQSKTSIVNRDLKIVAAHAGIRKKVTTHVARHTWAHFADNADLNSREIQSMLNHSSLSITENYLHQLRKSSELDDAADKIWE